MSLPNATAYATLAVLAHALIACGPESSEGRERAPIREVVAVASAPAELIAGAVLEKSFLERVGAEPTPTWSPSDNELEILVTSRHVLLIGAEFEPWAQRAGLPPSRTIELARGLDSTGFISTATVSHTHGKGPAHSHGGVVPTLWTDPTLLRAMIHGAGELLTGTLPIADDPATTQAALERRRLVEEQIVDYEAALLELKTALAGRRLLATDHGLEYIARAVNAPLDVALLEIEDGRPTNDHAASLLEAAAAKADHAGVLVWLTIIDPNFASLASDELGLTSVMFNLRDSESGDTVLPHLAANARELADAVSVK